MTTDSSPLYYAEGTAPSEPPIPAEVAQRAVEWLVELQAEHVPTGTLDSWRRWRAAHPDHERAWQRIESINGKLRHLTDPVSSAIAQATLAPPASPRRRRIIIGIAALLFTGSAAWMVRNDTHWRRWTADVRTGIGERRRLVLDDGTAVEMNSDSAINLAFSITERRLHLLAGEVLISTAQDFADRPFLVETVQGHTQALGTRFSVWQQPGATFVAVFDGAVRITPRAPAAHPLVLEAGQQARFTSDGIDMPQAADPNRIAWSEGFIIAKGMRLADFLAELSRHSARPLSCDPAVANLRVSGSYPLADIDKVLDALAAALSLQIETVTRFRGLRPARVHLAPRGKVRDAPA